MLIFRLKDNIVIHQTWSIHQVWSWLTWAVCVHRHQSQIKEEQMEAEDYNDSMSPETEDQHSPDTNHHEHDSACQPGFSSSPQSFHCWDPRPSVGPPPSDSQNWQLQLPSFWEQPFIYCFDVPVSVVCSGLTSLVLKGSSVWKGCRGQKRAL